MLKLTSCRALRRRTLSPPAPWRNPIQVVIGLITKTETNPFFVKMKEGADAAAKAKGAKLLSGAGKTDGDNAGQVTAMENMIAARREDHPDHAQRQQGHHPGHQEGARQGRDGHRAGFSPTDPADATDALFATDNYKAGVLIGQYAKAALGDKPAKIVMLDLFPGHPVGAQRHNGFLKGFGLPAPDAKSNELGKDARNRRVPWPTASATAPRARRRWKTACKRIQGQSTWFTPSMSRPLRAPTTR